MPRVNLEQFEGPELLRLHNKAQDEGYMGCPPRYHSEIERRLEEHAALLEEVRELREALEALKPHVRCAPFGSSKEVMRNIINAALTTENDD